jgi:hypothetical protein
MNFQILSKKIKGSGYRGSDCNGSIGDSTFILEDDSCYTLTNIFFYSIINILRLVYASTKTKPSSQMILRMQDYKII